jgi:hypothetical protein
LDCSSIYKLLGVDISEAALHIMKQTPRITRSGRAGFLDLPGELRNDIYRLTLKYDHAVNGERTKFPSIALLRTCKKIHEEAASILYSENTFTFGIALNFTNLQRMILHCFPTSLLVWPATTYHQWLRKLHIGISFTPGSVMDFAPPPFLANDLKAFRKAYDLCWDELELTYELCEGTSHLLTFTMAWLKFRCFEAIAHPNCKVITAPNITPLVRWCFERALTGRDPKAQLHPEQRSALREARRIAKASYNSGMRRVCSDLSWRVVWGCAFETTRGPVPNPNAPFQFITFVSPVRRRIYHQRDIYRRVETSLTENMCIDILLKDNKWRILAALEMPQERDLLIEKCAELRIYFALQELAAKVLALERSLGG